MPDTRLYETTRRGIVPAAPGLTVRASMIGGEAVKRKRRVGDRPQRQRQKRPLAIVSSDAIGAQRAAPGTTVDDRPLPIEADFDRDGLHALTTGAPPVARLLVNMARPQTVGTVVAMAGTPGDAGDALAAVNAGEAALIRAVKNA